MPDLIDPHERPQLKSPAIVDPYEQNSTHTLDPKQAQDSADALIYSNLLSITPSQALQHHDTIKEQLENKLGEYDVKWNLRQKLSGYATSAENAMKPSSLKEDAKAGSYGLTHGSVIAEWSRGKVAAPFESDHEMAKFMDGLGQMTGDIPFYLVGGVVGGAAGAAAGTVELPVIGTISGGAVGAGAGAMALPAGLRQWLVDKYAGKKVSAWHEVMDVVKSSGKAAIVGGITAAGGAPFAVGGALSEVAGAKVLRASTELAMMTTVGSLVEGRVPTAKDFELNAAMMAAMHVGMSGYDFAKESLPSIQGKMFDMYSKDGVHPATVASEAGKYAVGTPPTDNPMEVMGKIDNAIAGIQPKEAEQSPAEPVVTPASATDSQESTLGENTRAEGPTNMKTEFTGGLPLEAAGENEPQGATEGQTGIKNAVTEEERDQRGLSPVEVEGRRSFGTAFETAKQAVDSGKVDPRALATEVAENPRPLSAEESASLVYDRMRLQNEHQNVMAGIDDAREQGDTDRVQREQDRLRNIEDAINTNDEAARRTGYEQGLGLGARRMMLKQDYSLANLLQRARVASPNGEVSPELRGRLEELTSQLDVANKKIDDYEEQKKQGSAQRTVERIKGRQERAGKRAETKVDLKSKRDELYTQLNSELAHLSANPMLNPKLYELFGKIAANHIQDGIVTIEGIVDEIHANIQDKGISKREIRDYISQYGRTIEMSKDDVQVKLREARAQGRLISAIEDAESKLAPLKSGLQRDKQSERVAELRKQLNEAMRESGVDTKDPQKQQETSLASYKTRTANRIKELQKQLDSGDFTKKTKSATVLDQQAETLKAEAEKIKGQVDDAIAKKRLESRTRVEKGMAMFQKWRRAVLLSSVTTLGKLQTAAMLRFGTTPIEELLGGVLSKIPGISDIAAKAPREGSGVNISAEAKAFGQFFEKQTYLDIKDSAKTGKGSLDNLYGKNHPLPPEALDFFGHLHSAIKVLPKRAEFFRSVEIRSQWALDNHLDLQDPKVQATIAADAYVDANRAIFMQENFINDGFKALVHTFERNGLSGKSAAFMLRVVLPIVKVPTNIVFETSDFAIGSVKGGLEALNVILRKDGLKNLKMNEADNIMRSLKKGSMGLALLAIGYYAGGENPNFQAGGFYQKGDQKNKIKPEDFVVGGVTIPHVLQDTPVGLTMQMGATLRRVNDAYTVKGKSGGLVAGATAGALGAVQKVPFIDQASRMGEAAKSTDSAGLFIDDLIQSLTVPPDVRRIAKATDPVDAPRKATNLKETMESAIPGLRENVPVKTKNQRKYRIPKG